MNFVQIIFPPQFEPFQPYLSLPYLKGLLTKYKIISHYFDANIDFYWWIFNKYKDKEYNNEKEKYISDNLEKALKYLNSNSEIIKYKWAFNLIEELLDIISPPEIKLNLSSASISNNYSSKDILKFLNSDNNLFLDYFIFAKNIILYNNKITHFFFSLAVIDQLIPALTFAREIKKMNPHTKIVFGGSFISRCYTELKNINWIYEFVDFIEPGEGYKIIPRLFNIDYIYDGHINPDYSQLELKRYLSNDIVIPYIISNGCKWGKCNFCTHHLTYSRYRNSNINNVIEDIKNITKTYKVQYISFSDEYIPIDFLLKLSAQIMRNNILIFWSTFVKAEKSFIYKNVLKELYESGARLLMFGFESASQEVLNKMKKGINVEYFVPILRACKESNIAVRLDFMIGYPDETLEDYRKTFSFIKQNTQLIDTPFSSFALAIFELREGAPIMDTLKQKKIVKDRLRGDIDENYDFKHLNIKKETLYEFRTNIISYSKLNLKFEFITPYNKTHQLIYKNLYDEKKIQLPIMQISKYNYKKVLVKWNSGIFIKYIDDKIVVQNYVSRGIIELSVQLKKTVEIIRNWITIFYTFDLNTDISIVELIEIYNFLYRNDYIILKYDCANNN